MPKQQGFCQDSYRGYMDATAYDYELGWAWPGPRVSASVSGCREANKCISECGIVEVEVRLVRRLSKQDERKLAAAEKKQRKKDEPARERRRQRLIKDMAR